MRIVYIKSNQYKTSPKLNNKFQQQNQFSISLSMFSSNIQCQSPLFESIDSYNNKNSFLINLDRAWTEANQIPYIHNKKNAQFLVHCQYCKAYPFPKIRKKEQTNNKQNSSSPRKISKINTLQDAQFQQKQVYICQLCRAINDKKINQYEYEQLSIPQINLSKQLIQSLRYFHSQESIGCQAQQINNEQKCRDSTSLQTNNPQQKLLKRFTTLDSMIFVDYYEVSYLFTIDLNSLDLSILSNLRKVLIDFFKQKIENSLSQQTRRQSLQNQQNHQDFLTTQERYSIGILVIVKNNLFIADLRSEQTLSIDCFLEDRKQLLSLIRANILPIESLQNLNMASKYLDLLVQEKQAQISQSLKQVNKGKYKKGYNNYYLQSGGKFSKVMECLWSDSCPLNYYLPVWIAKLPILKYQIHRIKKSNIYSLVYLFYQESKNQKQNNQSPEIKNRQMKQRFNIMKQDKSTISLKEQTKIIYDNQQVYFLESTSQNHQFYYKLYELMEIVNYPKVFKAKYTIKSDFKYSPKILTQLPHFFIKPNKPILIENKSYEHNKFQFTIKFGDYRQRSELLIVNWVCNQELKQLKTKISQTNMEFKQDQNCSQDQLASKAIVPWNQVPSIYSSLYSVINIILDRCIYMKKPPKIQHKDIKPINRTSSAIQNQELSSVCIKKFCLILNDLINNFKIDSQIDPSLLNSLFLVIKCLKQNPYKILTIFSLRQSVEMIYRIIPIYCQSNRQEQSGSNIIFWGDGWMDISLYKLRRRESLEAMSQSQLQASITDLSLDLESIYAEINSNLGHFYCKQYDLETQFDETKVYLERTNKRFVYESQTIGDTNP